MPIHMVVMLPHIHNQSQIKSGMGSGLCPNRIKQGGVDINNLGGGGWGRFTVTQTHQSAVMIRCFNLSANADV